MPSLRFLQLLHRLGWEFWLPLPLIAVVFWIVGNFIAVQVLNRPYDSINKLQANTQLDTTLSITVLAINAEIDRSRGVTYVSVRATNATLKTLQYEFRATQADQVEVAIARELEIPVDHIRKLISYRIKD